MLAFLTRIFGSHSDREIKKLLPAVERINAVPRPVLRADGTLELLPSGYDARAKTFTATTGIRYQAMSGTQGAEAIRDLLAEFPFADSQRSLAVSVAAMLSMFCGGLLPKGCLRPVFVYVANAEGAGKTMLATCAIHPVHGSANANTKPDTEGEWQKLALATVREGLGYLLVDNVKGHFSSPTLEAFATAPEWTGRLLSFNKTFTGENNVTVFVTGNGATVSPDIRRRALFVELFMEQERAEDRVFKRTMDFHELTRLRPVILSALWGIVRAWNEAGRPEPSRKHASFPRWAEVVGGIVEHAGFGCPLETAQIANAADVDLDDMRALAAAMDPNDRMTFDEVVSLCRDRGLFDRIIGPSGDLDRSAKSAFGKLLSKYEKRILAKQRRFTIEGKGRSRCYRSPLVS